MNDMQPKAVCDERHGSLDSIIESLQRNHAAAELERKNDLEKIYKKLDEFGQRLPNWAVFAMTAGGGMIGMMAAALGHFLAGATGAK